MQKHEQKFIKNSLGNIAPIFALCLLAIFAAAGIAIDYAGMSRKHAEHQGYADAAALAAVISGETERHRLKEIASNSVQKNKKPKDELNTTLLLLQNGGVRVEVSGVYQMTLMGLFGFKESRIKAVAEALPRGGTFNLALVLDVTDSMAGSKLNALKRASQNLVTEISNRRSEPMISVVPFSSYVKLPLSYGSKFWLETESGGNSCRNVINREKSINCRQIGAGENENARTECDTVVTDRVCSRVIWDGCMGSRHQPWNANPNHNGNNLQGFTLLADQCHSTMRPLTKTISDVKSTISSLVSSQKTYIPAGLIWGWRSLTPEAPLVEADTSDRNEKQNYLLLMTDGNNTVSAGGTTPTFNGLYHWQQDGQEANELTETLCANIKADKIVVFTVAFDVPASQAEIKEILRNCASDPDKYFDVTSSNDLISVFDGIGKKLGEVRLIK